MAGTEIMAAAATGTRLTVVEISETTARKWIPDRMGNVTEIDTVRGGIWNTTWKPSGMESR